jgi:hypothetical protein
MNELELKDLFVSSMESDHIFDSKNRNLDFTNPKNETRIKNEGYFGQFDLVIAVVNRANKTNTGQQLEEIGAYHKVLMRTGQHAEIARGDFKIK